MGRLTYNGEIFTNVHKWDDEFTYLGIFVTGKLNQRNGEDYPLIDAIDIDWDGAYLKNLSTYLYTTEDVINVLDLFGKDHYDKIGSSYLSYVIENLKDDISYTIGYNASIIEENIFNNLGNQYDILEKIRDMVLDDTRYIKLKYEDVFDENGNMLFPEQEYYIKNEETGHFERIDNEYVKNHPDETYYQFILSDIIKLNSQVIDIYKILGSVQYDPEIGDYTYSGFYKRFKDINDNLDNLSYIAYTASEIAYNSYELAYSTAQEVENYKTIAYSAYYNSYLNTDKIGYHTTYNVYEKVNEYSENILEYIRENGVFTYNPNTGKYTQVTYNSNYTGDYYILYPVVPGTGIEKEIEDLANQMTDNTYVLSNLSVESKSENISLKIESNQNNPKERKITLDSKTAYVDKETGEITEGIVTYTGLINTLSYMFTWKMLK